MNFSHLYKLIIDPTWNTLNCISNLAIRNLVMQFLTWMWFTVLLIYFGYWLFFGLVVFAHLLLIFAVFITAATFAKAAERILA